MDQAHLHLIVTHLPIIGSLFGGIVLAYGLWVKAYQTKIAAYILLIISSAGAIVANLTGEAAEETVENIQGISKSMIEQHEDMAAIALVALIILGVSAIAGIILTLRKLSISTLLAKITLFITIISFALVAPQHFRPI